MKSKIKGDIRAYLRKIRKEIPGSMNAKFAFTSILKAEIEEYLNNNNDATIDNIIEQFGAPEDIAKTFDVNEYAEAIKKNRIKIIILSILIICLISISAVLTIALIDSREEGTIIVTTDSYYKG